MAANLFPRLERFREESQVMAAHWSIALNGKSVTQSVTYVGIELLWQLKEILLISTDKISQSK